MCPVCAVDSDISVSSVQYIPFREEIVYALVRPFCQPSRSEITNSCFDRVQAHVQKDDDSIFFQMRHCCRAVHGAAAGGDDMIAAIQSEEDPFLNRAKCQVAFLIDDVLQ